VAGALAGAWMMPLTAEASSVSVSNIATPNAATSNPDAIEVPIAPAPSLNPSYTGAPIPIPPLHFDPARAVMSDPKLTPGDVFPNTTKDDVCTPGWAGEHRHVTESEKGRVYSEYPDWHRTCQCVVSGGDYCCEIDHLIPLELGGSNDVKNLWPQPVDPRPGSLEKDSLEHELHTAVCHGKLSLADAQKCIASNRVECWKRYVVPLYGPHGRQRTVRDGDLKRGEP
jgi:hypothetical protein